MYTTRLNVLRALLTDTTNLAKTNNPVRTDLQLLSLLRKRANAAKSAASEFGAAKREDLRDKEEAQAAVLEEYAGTVETVDESEIKQIVSDEVKRLRETGAKVEMGSLMKRLLGEDGPLDGRPAEKSEVARAIRDAMGASGG